MARARRPPSKGGERVVVDMFDDVITDAPVDRSILDAGAGPETTGTGTHCADCGEPQFMATSGATCRNGHGGAPALEETRPVLTFDPSKVQPGDVFHVDGKKIPVTPALTASDIAREIFEHHGVPYRVDERGTVSADPMSEPVSPRGRAPMQVEVVPELPEAFGGAFGFTGHARITQARRPKRDGIPNVGKPAEPIRFVPIETRRLVEIADLSEVGGTPLDGVIVKISTPVRASERETFDGAGMKAELLARGAARVVLAPRIVPDVIAPRKLEIVERGATDPVEIVAAWFATEVQGLNDEERAEARAEALAILGDLGVGGR